MNPVKFAAMLLLQRVDAALRLERLKPRPDPYDIILLHRQKRRLCSRLRLSPTACGLAGN